MRGFLYTRTYSNIRVEVTREWSGIYKYSWKIIKNIDAVKYNIHLFELICSTEWVDLSAVKENCKWTRELAVIKCLFIFIHHWTCLRFIDKMSNNFASCMVHNASWHMTYSLGNVVKQRNVRCLSGIGLQLHWLKKTTRLKGSLKQLVIKFQKQQDIQCVKEKETLKYKRESTSESVPLILISLLNKHGRINHWCS